MKQSAASMAFAFTLFLGSPSVALAQGIPGGANALNETHGDWTVSCTEREGMAQCAMSQLQVQGESRQRVLAIELTKAADGDGTTGVLVLPFGLQLDNGVTLGLGEAAPFQSLRFSTCLPAGCLVPVSFDAGRVSAIGSSSTMAITAAANDSGEEVALTVSLRGFTSALARLAQLTAP